LTDWVGTENYPAEGKVWSCTVRDVSNLNESGDRDMSDDPPIGPTERVNLERDIYQLTDLLKMIVKNFPQNERVRSMNSIEEALMSIGTGLNSDNKKYIALAGNILTGLSKDINRAYTDLPEEEKARINRIITGIIENLAKVILTG